MSFVTELKRRKVFRVAVVYAATAFVVLQAADIMLPRLAVPEWALTLIVVLVVLGFPVALVLTWALELTPDGIKRTEAVAPGEAVSPPLLGKRTLFYVVLLVTLGVGLGAGWFLRPVSEDRELPGDQAALIEPQPIAQSIAVLPFANLSDDPANEYFADGLSEELLNVLAQVPSLQVVGRTSSFAWKGRSEDLREIGRQLGVTHILEGSVRRQHEKVRITAQLIRAADGFHLWSQTYDRTLDDVFVIQDDIAANVLEALQVVMDERQFERMRAAGVRDVEAFIAFQRGRELFQDAHGNLPLLETLKRANAWFDKAVARVPDFGAAYLIKADLPAHVLFDAASTVEEREAAHETLLADLDAAWSATANPAQRALVDFDRILFSDNWRLLPARVAQLRDTAGCPQPNWILVAAAMGHAETIADFYEHLTRCDPLAAFPWIYLAGSHLWAGDAEGALAAIEQGEATAGVHPWLSAYRQRVLLSLGRAGDAAAETARVTIQDEFFGPGAEALPLAAMGRIEAAEAALAARLDPSTPAPLAAGFVAAALGQRDRVNRHASMIDGWPGGQAVLMVYVNICFCGAPFDLDVTPNLRQRLEESGIPWPPPTRIDYPAKDW